MHQRLPVHTVMNAQLYYYMCKLKAIQIRLSCLAVLIRRGYTFFGSVERILLYITLSWLSCVHKQTDMHVITLPHDRKNLHPKTQLILGPHQNFRHQNFRHHSMG